MTSESCRVFLDSHCLIGLACDQDQPHIPIAFRRTRVYDSRKLTAIGRNRCGCWKLSCERGVGVRETEI